MSLSYNADAHTFTLSTARTTYQMKVDEHGYLLHLYYGERTEGDLSYLVTYCDRSGMCGCPHDVADRTYSLDVLPQEFPFQGTGDLRSPLLIVRDAEGTFGCDLRYKAHELRAGKYGLPGLPAVYDEGVSVTLADDRLGLEVELLFGVMPAYDVITRAAVVRNCGDARVTVEKLQSACLDFVHGDFDASPSRIQSLQAMARRPVYAVLSGHLHHNRMDEVQGVKTIMAGSFLGMDDYCVQKRIVGRAEQMVCVCDESGVRCAYSVPLQ